LDTPIQEKTVLEVVSLHGTTGLQRSNTHTELTISVWRRRVWGCRGRYVDVGWSSRWRRPPWARPRSTC